MRIRSNDFIVKTTHTKGVSGNTNKLHFFGTKLLMRSIFAEIFAVKRAHKCQPSMLKAFPVVYNIEAPALTKKLSYRPWDDFNNESVLFN
jgi:hypothetical protein